jgi:protein SCO1/2
MHPPAIGRGLSRSRRLLVLSTLVFVAVSCSRSEARRYQITGQVLAVDAARLEVIIAHDAIAGYMQAMTMPFKVREGSQLAGLTPGDLVRGQLVVTENDGFVEHVERTGYRELPASMRTPLAPPRDGYLLEGDTVPDVWVIDQDSRRRRLLEKPGVATVLTFTYTRCPFPTFCPLMDKNFQGLQQRILADPQLAEKVQLLSVTIDPKFDTPAVLRQHAERVKADPRIWSFVRLDEQTPGALAERFGVTSAPDERNPLVIVHNLSTVFIGPEALIAKILRGNDWTVADANDELKRILRPRQGGR